jgi:hypothetical protein
MASRPCLFRKEGGRGARAPMRRVQVKYLCVQLMELVGNAVCGLYMVKLELRQIGQLFCLQNIAPRLDFGWLPKTVHLQRVGGCVASC